MRQNLLVLCGIMLQCVVLAQNPCQYRITGDVVCTKLNEELGFATVYVSELNKYIPVNERGHFHLDRVCKGSYHFVIAQVGHLQLDTTINVTRDAHLLFNLQPLDTLHEIEIKGHRTPDSGIESLQKSVISGQALEQNRGGSLADVIRQVPGVTAVQSGPTVAKPMIHGLSGNRVLIVNNGVRLESQSWGSDHAPEIDPFIASEITVVKGAGSLQFGPEAIGGVLLVNPAPLPREQVMRGAVNLVGGSNGRGGAMGGMLETGYANGLSWRVQGSLRQYGTFQTPTYYLTNSALQERNFSGALHYERSKAAFDAYYSEFTTRLGIFSGAEAATAEELLQVFNQGRPQVPSVFSYNINREFQDVRHSTGKLSGFWNDTKLGKFNFKYSIQQNLRNEFGEADSSAPDAPQAKFELTTHLGDVNWEYKLSENWSGSAGIFVSVQKNLFDGTEARALVPDYNSQTMGAYLLEKWTKKKWSVEGGFRYDLKKMQVLSAGKSSFHPSSYQWGSVSGALGATRRITEHFFVNTCLSSGWRAPSAIEMFAHGIHQSVASYELGDSSLKSERSYQVQASANYSTSSTTMEISLYANTMRGFIFLSPQKDPIITANGTYLAFKYSQANALLTGIDLALDQEIIHGWWLVNRDAIVIGRNTDLGQPLIYMPPMRFNHGIRYKMEKLGFLKDIFVGVTMVAVSRQNMVPANSDFVAPPPGYVLWNAEAGFSLHFRKMKINVSYTGTNVFNTAYRDYLNRFRYFANEIGVNHVIRLHIPFNLVEKRSETEIEKGL